MLNTEYYDKEYLRKEDSEKVDEIELLRAEVLNDSAIEEFFDNRTSLNGDTAKSLVKDEILKPFTDFLRERIDYYICDFIISKIAGGDGLEKARTILGTPVYTVVDGVQQVDWAKTIYIDWGQFISAVINFLLVALILFIIIKLINNVHKAGVEAKEKLAKKEEVEEKEEEKK